MNLVPSGETRLPSVGTARNRKPLRLLLAMSAFVWAALVLAAYYRQLWRLLTGSGWDELGAYVVSARIFLAGLAFLTLAFVAFLVVAQNRLGKSSLRRRTARRDLALLALLAPAFLALTLISGGRLLDPSLPFLSVALVRAGAGAGAATLLLAAALTLGSWIGRALGWRYADRREHVPFALALGIGVFAYGGLALAAVGLYRPPVLIGAVTLVLAGAAVETLARLRRHGWPRLARPAALALPPGATPIWLTCAGLALLCAFLAALAPESQYDALWWHLTFPQHYLAAGRLVDFVAEFVSLYPMTAELWFGYALALSGSTAAVLLHFACLPLVGLVTYNLARRFVPGAPPWLAVALFVTIPTALFCASTANVDLFLTLFVTLALYALLSYVEQPRAQWLVLAGINLGLGMGTKHLGLFALALLGVGLALALWLRRAGWRRMILSTLALGSLALLVALPWYVRSYLASGNPVFELLYSVFGAYPPERFSAEAAVMLQSVLDRFGRPRTLPNLLTLPWDMTIHAARYAGTFGPLFLVLLPLLVLRRWRGALPWLIALALLWMLLWSSPLASFQIRHLVPVAPVLAVLAASAYTRVAALVRDIAGRWTQRLLPAVLGVLLLLNLPPFTFLHEVDRVQWQGWLSQVLHRVPIAVVIGGQSVNDYLTRAIRSYAVWQYANAHLPPDARVLTYSGGEQFYTYHDRLWAHATPAISAMQATTGHEHEALAALRQLGITHVILDLNPATWPNPDNYALQSAATRATWYEPLYADTWYALYRIRWEQFDPGP